MEEFITLINTRLKREKINIVFTHNIVFFSAEAY